MTFPNRSSFAQSSSSSAGDELLLEGTVRSISFRNSQTEFAIFRAETPVAPGSTVKEVATVIGVIPPTLRVGSTFSARGKWEEHAKFGKQFRAFSLTEKTPTGVEEIIEYLGSGEIRGLGPALAARIVEKFGVDTLRVLDETPEALRSISGIGERKFEEICAVWQETKRAREVMLFLQRLGLGPGTMQRIRTRYGLRTVEVITRDPYVLVEDLWGIGFLRADEIAGELGIAPDSTQRIRAGMLYELKKASEDGNCFLLRSVLLQKTQSLLKLEDGARLSEVLEQVISERAVVVDSSGERIYSQLLWDAERITALAVSRLLRPENSPRPEIDREAVNRIALTSQTIADADGKQIRTIHLSDEQRRAITLAAEKQLLVITGGPGCGKTTVLRTIVELFRDQGLSFKLAAPTGKASQRMAEVCRHEASTIHRLLKFDPATREFIHNDENRLELDALVIDEVSMVDLPLASSLLQALPDHARLILVGDADQLPSVGPGLFLADMLTLPEVGQVRLTNLFRRSEQSLISYIAHQINAGEVPDVPEPDGLTKSDAYFLKAFDVTEAAALIERLVVDQLPKKFGFSGAEISVLSPMNKGELGVISLNQRLQRRLVPLENSRSSVRVGNIEFRLGDRVCQRTNNYNIVEGGVFNGEQGEIIGVDAEGRKVFVRFWDGREVEYGSDTIPQLDLAYAISIHRAQGSESPAVILALHEAHSILLERQLIYTAITRAKKLLIIVGTKKAFVYAVRRTPSKRRNTNLVGRIQELLR